MLDKDLTGDVHDIQQRIKTELPEVHFSGVEVTLDGLHGGLGAPRHPESFLLTLHEAWVGEALEKKSLLTAKSSMLAGTSPSSQTIETLLGSFKRSVVTYFGLQIEYVV